jgi:hypothetical protein
VQGKRTAEEAGRRKEAVVANTERHRSQAEWYGVALFKFGGGWVIGEE